MKFTIFRCHFTLYCVIEPFLSWCVSRRADPWAPWWYLYLEKSSCHVEITPYFVSFRYVLHSCSNFVFVSTATCVDSVIYFSLFVALRSISVTYLSCLCVSVFCILFRLLYIFIWHFAFIFLLFSYTRNLFLLLFVCLSAVSSFSSFSDTSQNWYYLFFRLLNSFWHLMFIHWLKLILYLVITILSLPFSVWARIQPVSDLTLSVPIGGKSVQFLLIERNSTQVFIPTRSHSFNIYHDYSDSIAESASRSWWHDFHLPWWHRIYIYIYIYMYPVISFEFSSIDIVVLQVVLWLQFMCLLYFGKCLDHSLISSLVWELLHGIYEILTSLDNFPLQLVLTWSC